MHIHIFIHKHMHPNSYYTLEWLWSYSSCHMSLNSPINNIAFSYKEQNWVTAPNNDHFQDLRRAWSPRQTLANNKAWWWGEEAKERQCEYWGLVIFTYVEPQGSSLCSRAFHSCLRWSDLYHNLRLVSLTHLASLSSTIFHSCYGWTASCTP